MSSVVAIIAAYNEADIIGQVVGDLIAQGVSVYLLDHGSTDRTVSEAEPYLGRGLLGIERFPGEDSEEPAGEGRFTWEAILRRKETLARELGASWFLHHDADEFRESPWSGVTLAEGIRRVDALGYNAIDFAVLTFWPTHDRFRPGDDVRRAFTLYEPGQPWDKLQIKCWKATETVDLVSSGGHEARFPGRRVFPLRFILRHYPIRGQAHGERKVFRERLPRFLPAERERGWHVQYDGMAEGHRFIREPATLIPYDADVVRLGLLLRHREVEAREAAAQERIGGLDRELGARTGELQATMGQLLARESELQSSTRELEELRSILAERERDLEAARRESRAAHERLEGIDASLRTVLDSRSWRWTAPLRAVRRLLFQRRRS